MNGSSYPYVLRRIELSNDPGGIPKDNGEWWAALEDNCVRSHDTMRTQDQVTPGAHNGSSTANPTAMPYPDPSTLSDGLLQDGPRYVFVPVQVVLDEHRRRDEGVMLNVDGVLSGYLSPGRYLDVVINHDYGYVLVVRWGDVDPRVLSDKH